MSTDIFIQPSYQLFRKAVSEHIAPLVIVVGSGLSTDANLPDWKTLRKFIQEKIDNKYRSSKSIGTPFNTGLYQQAIQTKNYWTFFKLAKTLLTDVTFTDLIKAELDPKIINVPSSYKSLFRLNPKGVVTLNLDRLSGKALSELHPGEHFIPIYGTELTRKWSLINDERPYLVYLHGHVTDSTTWVLDQDELSRLTRSPAHSLFLSTLYLNNTVLFAGVSANDIALSGALLALNRDGFRPSRLFWLTSRNDVTVERWARENRVQLIHYAAQTNSDHEKVILDISSDLGKYRSIDIDRPDPFVIQTRDFSNVTTINMSPREVANLRAR